MAMPVSENQEAPEIKVQRKNVYYITTFAAFVVLCGLTMAFSKLVWTDMPSGLLFTCILIYVFGKPLWIPSNIAAKIACRRLGLSLEGKKIERIAGGDSAIKSIRVGQPLIIGNQSVKYCIAVLMTLGCIVSGPCLFANPKTFDNLLVVACIVLIFSVLCVISFCSWSNVRKPLVCIDNQGVAHCDVFGLQNYFAKWEEIESCEVVHIYDVFGQERQRYIMINQVNSKQFKIYIGYVSETERIANFIKSVFNGEKPV